MVNSLQGEEASAGSVHVVPLLASCLNLLVNPYPIALGFYSADWNLPRPVDDCYTTAVTLSTLHGAFYGMLDRPWYPINMVLGTQSDTHCSLILKAVELG